MKFFCLTSISTKKIPPVKPVVSGIEIIHANSDVQINDIIKKFREYDLTEIEIGYDENYKSFNRHGELKLTYIFIFRRQNSQRYEINMEPGTIRVINIDWEKYVIDLDISQEEIAIAEDVVLKIMRIRHIKNTDTKGMKDQDYKNYENYLDRIKECCSNNPDCSVEDAFSKNKMQSTGTKKSLEQTIRAIEAAVKDLCDPENGSTNNVSDQARYKDKTPINWDYYYQANKHISITTQSDYHRKKVDSKARWSTLTFESTKMSNFDSIWFDAVNLTELSAKDIEIVKTDEKAWEEFAKGIQRLKKLQKLIFRAKLENIPQKVFECLPLSTVILDLSGNNLISIPPEIVRLSNLLTFDLSGNEMLNEDGIPWNNLPQSIELLRLNNTAITRIPEDIKHLSSLSDLYLENTNLGNGAWASINNNLIYLAIGFVEHIEHINDSTLPGLKHLVMSSPLYQSFSTARFPSTLKELLLIKNRLEDFSFNSNLQNLTILNLSHNQIKVFPWEFIPNTLKSLNLSHNELEQIGSMNYWPCIKDLDISFNNIKSFVYDLDMDVFENARSSPSDIATWIYGVSLNISHNKLRSLPQGFENYTPLRSLDISYNNGFDLENINESLWNRLPTNGKLRYLGISGIHVNRLSCMVQNLPLIQLDAIDCNLKYICPQISRNPKSNEFVLNITNNEALQQISFIPKTVLPFPEAEAKCEKLGELPRQLFVDHYTESYELKTSYNIKIIGNAAYRCTSRQKKLLFDFKKAEKAANLQHFCKCCTNCSEITDDEIVEQLITMDIRLCENNDDIKIWEPGTWKSRIKTRLCNECKEWYKKEAKKLAVTFKRKADVLKEVPSSQK